jgi:hypothetical protein
MLNQIVQIRMPDGAVVALTDWSDKPLFASCDMGNGYTAEEINLFQVTIGRPVPSVANPALGAITPRTNTANDTNVATQGGLSSTEEFLVYSIRPDVQLYAFDPNDFTTRVSGGTTLGGKNSRAFMPAPTLSALAELNAKVLIELEITQKIFSQAGFAYFNPGFGQMAGITTTATGAGVTPASQGLPSDEAVRSLVIPSHIGGQEKFKLRIRNAANQPIWIGKTEATPSVVTGASNGPDNIMATVRVYLDGLYKRPVS